MPFAAHVIDDEPDVRAMLEQILKAAGYVGQFR
jgi:DNA-binding response OmpR family regulator